MRRVPLVLMIVGVVLSAATAAMAQVQTGSITGNVTDASGAIMPGVVVSLTGERLIGGVQTQTTDANGNYRFDRLPPGSYRVKFDLPGFRTVEHQDVRLSAAFVATVNAKLEVGTVSEAITVSGRSPTVDTKSNLQQTVMTQDILEGVPTGRDPWSVAKLIPGVQVSTYDVGGTQSIQQSGLSAHGSSGSDVSFNVDGATVNWPGGGGGSTMMYYDQGMFEEINYLTSAIPAEVMAGGISINMVTKDAGNRWRGQVRYSFSNDDLQAENHLGIQRLVPTFLGNPTLKTYDVNLAGGGRVIRDRLWFNGTIRRWIVNKLTNTKNLDGTQALDDNTLKNYSGKAVASLSPSQKVMVSYLWNDKIRGHRRDSNDKIPDIAAVVQTNPVQTTQVKYTGVFGPRLVFESGFSVMDGQTNYSYQPGTPADAIRKIDNSLGEVFFAAPRHEEQPNSRHQLDNTFSYNTHMFGGDHMLKGGIQYARLYWEQRYTVQGHHHVEYSNGNPSQVRLFNTPTVNKNLANVLGFFFQDAWSISSRLTVNLGFRFDRYQGIIPAESNANVAFDLFDPGVLESDGTGPYIGPISRDRQEVLSQTKGVWRTGVVYDLMGDGRTALKANYSRYALQVGIDRVTAVNALTPGSRTCPWSDPNGDGVFQASEITLSQCGSFSGGINTLYAADGVNWPYTDEATVSLERQILKDMRVAVTYYYRSNRDQLGVRNTALPPSVYTQHTITVPNGPGGTVSSPTPLTTLVFNPSSTAAANVRDNEPEFNTEYQGVEFTASKRFSDRWQMVAGLTIGRNEGGLGGDLNDPNQTIYRRGIIGNDSKFGFRLSGSYQAWNEITVAGSLVSNQGYPYVSTFNLTKAAAALQGITLTRASQNITLSQRGDERLPTVTLADIRISRPFRLGSRKVVPTLDFFNLANVSTVVSLNNSVGGTYLEPREIISPRIIRVGFVIDF